MERVIITDHSKIIIIPPDISEEERERRRVALIEEIKRILGEKLT